MAKERLRKCKIHGSKLIAGVKCANCNRARTINWRINNPRKYRQQLRELNKRDYWRKRYKNPKIAAAIRIKMRGGIGDGAPPREGICPICLEVKLLVFDHCHKRRTFRGWICSSCNAALGTFKDSIGSLRRAIKYLQTHRRIKGE
jgi:hypothetical protein